MGFLGKLFKRKKGGTLVGNLIRGVANTASGGILGNGQQLLKDEPEQKVLLPQNPTYQAGQNIGTNINDQIQQIPVVVQYKQNAIVDSLKKNWYLVLFPVLLLLFLMWQNVKLKTKIK